MFESMRRALLFEKQPIWLKKACLLNAETRSAHPGQGALIAIAVTIMIALVLGGTTMSSLMQMNSKRTVITRQSLQTYYVAQAGIQEALATRMLPRSNALNFMNKATLPTGASPYFPDSGLVYEDPGKQRGLIGVYRYLILGGDPSKNASGNYYNAPSGPPFSLGPDTTNNPSNPKPRLLTFQSSPDESPFYIISNGLTCLANNGQVGKDQFIGSAANQAANPQLIGTQPRCNNGYSLDEITLVTKVQLESEKPGVWDQLNQTWTYRNYVIGSNKDYSSPKNIPLPGSTFVPGSGWVNSVNFTDAWTHSSTSNSPVKPTQIVFFDFATSQIYHKQTLDTGSTTTIPSTTVIPPKASMMLYFDGPIDYRSLSVNYDRNLDGCKTGVGTCAIQFTDSSNKPYTGMTVVPIMPYLTKVLLLAPIGNNLNNATTYKLVLDQNFISSFSGARLSGKHTIEFQTCPVSGGPAYCY
jgi:hypothetical protein